ncbi:MAG: hypothetical protein JST49_09150 [Bacteroidetes bacterium]|nr:hypothetical protein [Bacteroidota bacterium]
MNLRRIEYASAALLLLSVGLALAKVNGIAMLTALAGGTLALTNIISAFWGYGSSKPSTEELAGRSSAEKLLTYALGSSSAVIVLSLIYMLNIWPSARIMAMAGLATAVPVAGIIAYLYFAKGMQTFSKLFIRAAIYTLIASAVFSISPLSIIEYKYGHNPLFPAYKQAVLASDAEPTNSELRKQTHHMLQEIIRQEREHK